MNEYTHIERKYAGLAYNKLGVFPGDEVLYNGEESLVVSAEDARYFGGLDPQSDSEFIYVKNKDGRYEVAIPCLIEEIK